MKHPTPQEINHITAYPEQWAMQMTLPEIDQVIYGFVSVRYDKERWLESTK
jgi:hypothetical protein